MENKETADHSGMTVLRILTVSVLRRIKGADRCPVFTRRGDGAICIDQRNLHGPVLSGLASRVLEPDAGNDACSRNGFVF